MHFDDPTSILTLRVTIGVPIGFLCAYGLNQRTSISRYRTSGRDTGNQCNDTQGSDTTERDEQTNTYIHTYTRIKKGKEGGMQKKMKIRILSSFYLKKKNHATYNFFEVRGDSSPSNYLHHFLFVFLHICDKNQHMGSQWR